MTKKRIKLDADADGMKVKHIKIRQYDPIQPGSITKTTLSNLWSSKEDGEHDPECIFNCTEAQFRAQCRSAFNYELARKTFPDAKLLPKDDADFSTEYNESCINYHTLFAHIINFFEKILTFIETSKDPELIPTSRTEYVHLVDLCRRKDLPDTKCTEGGKSKCHFLKIPLTPDTGRLFKKYKDAKSKPMEIHIDFIPLIEAFHSLYNVDQMILSEISQIKDISASASRIEDKIIENINMIIKFMNES